MTAIERSTLRTIVAAIRETVKAERLRGYSANGITQLGNVLEAMVNAPAESEATPEATPPK